MMVFKAPPAVSMKCEGDFTVFSDLLNIGNWLVASVLAVTTLTEYKLALQVQRRFRWKFCVACITCWKMSLVKINMI
jgi:hypothetical protein